MEFKTFEILIILFFVVFVGLHLSKITVDRMETNGEFQDDDEEEGYLERAVKRLRTSNAE